MRHNTTFVGSFQRPASSRVAASPTSHESDVAPTWSDRAAAETTRLGLQPGFHRVELPNNVNILTYYNFRPYSIPKNTTLKNVNEVPTRSDSCRQPCVRSQPHGTELAGNICLGAGHTTSCPWRPKGDTRLPSSAHLVHLVHRPCRKRRLANVERSANADLGPRRLPPLSEHRQS